MNVFHPVHLTYGDARTPREGETGGDSDEVSAEEAGEALHGLRRILLGLEVPGPVDVRAGEPDLKGPLVQAFADAAVRSAHTGIGTAGWSVTVAAKYADGTVRYFTVPVTTDTAGSSFMVTASTGLV
ncbi:hypothetical protein [Streptomyces justiciae]|uniref:hypothetical protein n=1 Tax=Streptomyces justiciae TaxID=2780140 RepID=UPI0018812131|nr:hypothetical protein [Streptomyces justiciae]MBE8476043.1 hypothetical protein [Streptomyces justiciae]